MASEQFRIYYPKSKAEIVYKLLKTIHKSPLTPQQKRTIRGQVLAGDVEGARKGFEKLMGRGKQ